jgi:putative oxidoreductase
MEWNLVELLRVLCGLWFLPHMAGKAMHYRKASGTFDAAGFKPGMVFVGVTIAMEALAAIGLVFGIYPKIAAILAILVLLGASYAVVKINGFNWRWQKMGPEFPLFWSLVLALTAIV